MSENDSTSNANCDAEMKTNAKLNNAKLLQLWWLHQNQCISGNNTEMMKIIIEENTNFESQSLSMMA